MELDYDTDFYAAKWTSEATKKGSEQISLPNHTTHTAHTTHARYYRRHKRHTPTVTYFAAGVILHSRKQSRR